MTAGPPRPACPFAPVFLGTALAVLAALGGLSVAADPYRVFHAGPDGAANRLLDTEMRRAKPLQLFRRPGEAVLIGSSTIYRGIDPADLPGGGFNLGLSSLMATELPAAAALVAARPGTRRVVIGLDFFSFTTHPAPTPLDASVVAPLRRLEAFVTAALSLRALAAAGPGGARPTEPGEWAPTGFKTSPPLPASVIQRMAGAQDWAGIRYRPDLLPTLETALATLRGRDVRVFLSPVNDAQWAYAAASGRAADIARWRRDVAAVAFRANVPFRDLARDHPFRDFAPRSGSSDTWLDQIHYRPPVGRWILGEIGFATRPEPATR